MNDIPAALDKPMSPRQHAPHLGERRLFHANFDITATPSAAAPARLFIKTTLRDWGARGVLDDALSVGGELVSNAIRAIEKRAATNALGQWQPNGISKLIRLRLLGLPQTIAIEVWDRVPDAPLILPFSMERENGRGLYLIDALSVRWGYYWMRPSGKVVWSELAATNHQAVSA
jgi:hypothetical protein